VVVAHAFPVLCWHFKMNYVVHIRSPSLTINVLKSITHQREGICQGIAKKKSAAMVKSWGLETLPGLTAPRYTTKYQFNSWG
jgi:hypothetical protein